MSTSPEVARINALGDAVRILLTARVDLVNIDPLWQFVNHAANYLEQQTTAEFNALLGGAQ